MHFNIKYGVTETTKKTFKPVLFINDQTSSYYPHSRKTAKGALKLAEDWANEVIKEYKHFNNTVTLIKWEHSVI